MTMNKPYLLRELADAIDALERMALYSPGETAMSKPDKVWLRWEEGSATTGYDDIAKAMSGVIADIWHEIRDEAVHRQTLEVERLRRNLAPIIADD